LAFMVTMESTLSYIGLGVQPPEPSWGNLMRDGQAYLNSAWWIAAFSGMFLVIFVLSINIFAEGLRRVTTQRQRL
jgi:peptide/nickel transport system permease protein